MASSAVPDSAPAATSLSQLPPHAVARVAEVRAEADDAVRLKSLGICVGRRLQLVKSGDPLVVRVVGSRVGISARLADGVFVDGVEPG